MNGTTIVTIRKIDRTTRVAHLPIFMLDYVAGDSRPFSIQEINLHYMKKVVNADGSYLEEGKTYLCNWETTGKKNINPVTGEETDKFAMRFTLCDTSNPLAWAVELKKFRQVFGDNKEVEQKERARHRTSPSPSPTPTLNIVANSKAVNAGFDLVDEEEN